MKRVALLILLVLGMSACTIRLDVGVDVKEDETGSLTMFIGLDDEMSQLASQFGGDDTSIVDQLTQQAPEGFDSEPYSEDGFEGVKLSTTFNSIADLNTKLTSAGSDQAGAIGGNLVNDFSLTHEGDEFHFSANLTGVDQGLTDVIGEAGGGDMLSGFDPGVLSDAFDVRFSLTLPGNVKDNNADTVNGNTLTWNLSLDDPRDTIQAVSSTAGSSSALYIGGGAVVLAALLGGGVVMSRRKKKAAVDAVASAPTAPAAPESES